MSAGIYLIVVVALCLLGGMDNVHRTSTTAVEHLAELQSWTNWLLLCIIVGIACLLAQKKSPPPEKK